MLTNNAAIGDPTQLPTGEPEGPPEAKSEKVVIDTRFGTMEFDRDLAISMPRGMMGFPHSRDFGLARLPDAGADRFMLLQSLSELRLSFLMLPLPMENDVIAANDLVSAQETLAIAPEDFAVALVVTIRDVGGEAQISVNLRAPIFLDTRQRLAWQHVLHNERYPIRHVLTPDQQSASNRAG